MNLCESNSLRLIIVPEFASIPESNKLESVTTTSAKAFKASWRAFGMPIPIAAADAVVFAVRKPAVLLLPKEFKNCVVPVSR